MKSFFRFVSLVVLSTFLGLVVAESAHAHPLAATTAAHCTLCKAAHQAPALVDPGVPHEPLSEAEISRAFVFLPHLPHVVAVSHGLAPPVR